MIKFTFTMTTALGTDIWTITSKEVNEVQVEASTMTEAMDKGWEQIEAMYEGNESVISHMVSGTIIEGALVDCEMICAATGNSNNVEASEMMEDGTVKYWIGGGLK